MLHVQNLTVEYTSARDVVRPLDDVNLSVAAGETAVVLGPSGSGKTTLLSCIGGLLTPTSGQVRVGGVEVTALTRSQALAFRREHIGFVFQSANLMSALTAIENVAMPLLMAGVRRRTALERAGAVLESVGLAGEQRRRPGRMSGGQRQRVAVARALVGNPPLLVADEPTANLDGEQAAGVIGLLSSLAGQGRTIVVSTHDHRLLPMADQLFSTAAKAGGTAGVVCRYHEGETIVRQGDAAHHVYEIVEGMVRVGDGTLMPGEAFGATEVALGLTRPQSATALSACTLRALDLTEYRTRATEHSVSLTRS